MRITEVVNQERSGAQDVLEAVATDPALAARILRTVNSSQYGLRNAVGDLKSAISLLGFREVRNLAITAFVSDLFRNGKGYRNYDRQALWEHMVTVATTARALARSLSFSLTAEDEAYLAGLLHDVGFVLIDQQLHQHFRAVLDEVEETGQATDKVERQVLSFDHCQLGVFVARRWKFPEPICDAIEFHHRPESYDGPHRNLLHLVCVANYLATTGGCPSLGVANLAAPSESVYAGLSITRSQAQDVWHDVAMQRGLTQMA